MELTAKISKAVADDLANRYEIDKRRLEGSGESIEAQLALQQTIGGWRSGTDGQSKQKHQGGRA